MKHVPVSLLFSALFLFFSLSTANSKDTDKLQSDFYSELKTAVSGLIADSIYVYGTSYDFSGWDLNYVYIYYNNNENQVDSIYNNNYIKGEQLNNYKNILEYNSDGLIIMNSYYQFQYYGMWTKLYYYGYFYDQDKKITKMTYNDCYNNADSWFETYEYENNKLVEKTKMLADSHSVANFYKVKYSYNNRNMIVDSVMYLWNGSKWDTSQVYHYSYNSLDSIDFYTRSLYDPHKLTLDIIEKFTYTYDSNGLNTGILCEDYSHQKLSWVKMDTSTYTYDEKNRIIKKFDQEWINGILTNDSLTNFFYSEDNKSFNVVNKYWDTEHWDSDHWFNNVNEWYYIYPDSFVSTVQVGWDTTWRNYVKVVSFLRKTTGVKDYPSETNTQFKDGEIVDLYVYDLTGGLMAQKTITYSKTMNPEEINKDLAQGVYLLIFKSKNKIAYRKITSIR